MKKFLVFSIFFVSYLILLGTNNTIKLEWNYPPEQVTNVTFNVYTSTNLINWIILTNVATTNVILEKRPGPNFFYVTATNAFGESIPNIHRPNKALERTVGSRSD